MVDGAAVAAGLRALLPPDSVLHGAEAQRPFERDARPGPGQSPLATVLPDSTEQVQAVMRYCHRRKVPVVPRGAGTGLAGGALPRADGVLLALSKMNRIINIDAEGRRARVEAGARNLAISDAARPYGLRFAPDPASRSACTIGGNIAADAGGMNALKYGAVGRHLESLRVVSAEGELLDLGGPEGGLNLLPLLVGSEGALGIVVEATVMLRPRPPCAETLLCAFPQAKAAADAADAMLRAGIMPSALEMLDGPALRAVANCVSADYPADTGALLLAELEGCASEVQVEMDICRGLALRFGASEARRAEDDAQRRLFREGFERALWVVGSATGSAAGGALSGAHGAGIAQLEAMAGQFSEAELEQFQRIKAAFDPRAVLNPGKKIPEIERCRDEREQEAAPA